MPGPGVPELLVLAIVFLILAVPAVIAYFVYRHFKRSKRVPLMNERPPAPFSSPQAVGELTKGLLIFTLILVAVSAVSGILRIELLSRIARGYGYRIEEAVLSDARQRVIGILQLLFWFVTGVAFLIWFYRMHKNLPGLGQRRLVFTPGWAVGFFFVPFLNLVRPFQAMRELWHGSDPGGSGLDIIPDDPIFPTRPGTPPLVGWWWALYLIFNFVGYIAGSFNLTSRTIPDLQAASVIMVVADLLEISSAWITIRLVGRLTTWQVEKAELIRSRVDQAAVPSASSPL